MAGNRNSENTKRLILAAAGDLFSREGFQATTIADICRQAGTNIASVNYHFGNKQALYVEAWREAFRLSHEKHPIFGGVPTDAPAEERLRGWVVSRLKRIVDPECHDFEIFHKELASPTGYLVEAMQEAIGPIMRGLSSIIRDLLGSGATEDDVRLCEMSIQAQCMNPMIMDRRESFRRRHPGLPKPPVLNVDIDRIAEHIVRFSLEGINGVRRQLEARRAEGPVADAGE